MNGNGAGKLHNLEVIDNRGIPSYDLARFRETVIGEIAAGARLASFFGARHGDETELTAILAYERVGELRILSTLVGSSYPAITPECPQAHLFEREIAEQWGVTPTGHPWLKPVRFHHSYRPGHDAWGRADADPIEPGVTDFFRVAGEEIHEVAVGPVHAGVIEPGHFRFQCHGEEVLHLEISLGYQHRGVERALLAGPNPRTIHYLETLAGDTSVGHALAYCQAVESLTGCQVPARAETLRGIALELERVANHLGDLGALAGDVGYLPTSSYCGRLRGDVLNLTALLCGSRFGRGLVRPGGVIFDLDPERAREFSSRLEKSFDQMKSAVNLLWESPSVMARFLETGVVSRETAAGLGLVGVAARACGLERDVRFDFPSGIYRLTYIPVSTWVSGDVFARAYVRWLEIQRSVNFILEQVGHLPEGPVMTTPGELPPDRTVVSMVAGWRGGICHVIATGPDRRFQKYKVVDPSFHNWMGLAMALRNETISDFPLCNKSFNLSYCGHDL